MTYFDNPARCCAEDECPDELVGDEVESLVEIDWTLFGDDEEGW